MTKVAELRDLHRPGVPLVLPNAWDARSARLVAAAGLPAVATSSAAVAGSLGYRDGEDTPPGEMFAATARIVAAVDVPVTADVERGYGLAPVELVERLIATGAAGCNLEDSDPRTGTLLDADRQSSFLADVRAAARTSGADLVINARIDTYLAGTGEPAARLAETIRRARRYHEAGADCVYPILMNDERDITDLIAAIDVPVNILAGRSRTVAELARLGVARVSFGPSLYDATGAHLAELIGAIER
ncbi:isocitrate lyase/phosphoenolpyruvate mutase family protein [Winogradskya consettensis]|uniref:Carboxyvinyl-carboxyphosphonate phosphorylmutase n=1 Tax=Winogradskya consettensis TaxID=113560 RepID=A0A919SQ10_9ACTN|nr:isocitrate lyase/phosphoenolpyruvate mutase family protein [Actinoplanes consettensis]GIM76220.1 carboxyvinyl-carboxyphosphonate phosphorylmutase [Actinoplanes consettensis]